MQWVAGMLRYAGDLFFLAVERGIAVHKCSACSDVVQLSALHRWLIHADWHVKQRHMQNCTYMACGLLLSR